MRSWHMPGMSWLLSHELSGGGEGETESASRGHLQGKRRGWWHWRKISHRNYMPVLGSAPHLPPIFTASLTPGTWGSWQVEEPCLQTHAPVRVT